MKFFKKKGQVVFVGDEEKYADEKREYFIPKGVPTEQMFPEYKTNRLLEEILKTNMDQSVLNTRMGS